MNISQNTKLSVTKLDNSIGIGLKSIALKQDNTNPSRQIDVA